LGVSAHASHDKRFAYCGATTSSLWRGSKVRQTSAQADIHRAVEWSMTSHRFLNPQKQNIRHEGRAFDKTV
jgi:hypothetical protein